MAKKVAAAPAEYTSAMDKLRDELAKSRDNYVRVVGEYLTEFLLAHPEAEGKIMDADKSIKGSLETVRKEAEKVKSGNMAVLDDKTVFGIVLGYFGIEDEPGTPPPATQAPPLSGEAFGNATMEAPVMPPLRREASGEVARSAGGVIPAADPFDLDALLGGVG